MSGELNHQEFRELVLDAYLTDPIPPITCMTDKALMRLEKLLRERYEAEAKSRREATLHVCHLKDAVCGDRPSSWCDKCPKRPAAQTEREAFEATDPIPTPSPPFATYDEHGLGCDDAIQDFYHLHCQEVETRAFNRGFDAASLPAPQQATPAQEVHPLASRCYAMSEPHLSGYRLVLGFETLEAVDAAHTWVANVRKAPQQATPDHFPDAKKMVADQNTIKKMAQATPDPVPADQAKWCEYVAGMVDCWVSAEWSNYHHKDEDRRVKAIAGIIERRLWALQKQEAATPEPVGEPVGTVVHATLNGQAKPWVTVALNQDADLPNGTKLFTRPAPGVPEGLEDQIMEALRDGLSVCMSVSVSRDRKISRDGCTLYAQTEEWCRWLDAEVGPKIRAAVDALAAAQAKGGAA